MAYIQVLLHEIYPNGDEDKLVRIELPQSRLGQTEKIGIVIAKTNTVTVQVTGTDAYEIRTRGDLQEVPDPNPEYRGLWNWLLWVVFRTGKVRRAYRLTDKVFKQDKPSGAIVVTDQQGTEVNVSVSMI